MSLEWIDADWVPWAELFAAAAIVAACAAWAERRRARRSDPDAVGFMPWTGIFMLALFVVVVSGALGLREFF